MFNDLDETSKTLLKISTILYLAFSALGAFFISDSAPYAADVNFQALIGGKIPFLAGLFLGFALTVLKILMIDRSCKKALDMDAQAVKLYGTGQYFIRFFLTGAVLVAAMFIPQFGFLGCALGMLILQFSGYITPFWEKRKKADL